MRFITANWVVNSVLRIGESVPGISVGIFGQTLGVRSQLLIVVGRVRGNLAVKVVDGKGHPRTGPVVGNGVRTAHLRTGVVLLRSGSVAVALVDKSALDGLDVVVNSEGPGAGVLVLVAGALGVPESPCLDGVSAGSSGLGGGSGSSRDSSSCEDDRSEDLSDLHFEVLRERI